MSHIVPPMLSSTPPPVDDQVDDDEDDEFGDFRVADISLNLSALNTLNESTESPEPWVRPKSPTQTISPRSLTPDSPGSFCSPGHSPSSPWKSGLPNGIGPPPKDHPEDIIEALTLGCDVDTVRTGEPPGLVLDDGVPDEAQFPADDVVETGQSWNKSSDEEVVMEVSLVQEEGCDTTETSPEDVSNSCVDRREAETTQWPSDVNSSEVSVVQPSTKEATPTVLEEVSEDVQEDDDWGEMSSFTNFPVEPSHVIASEKSSDFVAFPPPTGEESGWSEEPSGFAEFQSHPVSAPDEDDFDDFESADFHSAATTPQSSGPVGFGEAVTMMFGPDVERAEDPEQTNTGLLTTCLRHCLDDSSSVWGHLKELETSHALSYQWPNSAANQTLLSSLNIDSRNILFGPRWNGSVPRFAANLGFSPLEPMKAVKTVEPTPEEQNVPRPVTAPVIEEVVPAAQFDWTSSGLTNPLDCAEKEANGEGGEPGRTPQLSVEACHVIKSFPDLSFLSARKLMCVANQNYERYTTRTRP